MTGKRGPGISVVFFLCAVAVCLSAESVSAQTLQYSPYGSWRGHAVARDGLFHVQRYRWGNGITPAGASVANTLIPYIPAIVGAAVGRGDESTSASRGSGREPWAGWDEYARAQDEANALLKRTASLAGGGASPAEVPLPTEFERLDPKVYLPSTPW